MNEERPTFEEAALRHEIEERSCDFVFYVVQVGNGGPNVKNDAKRRVARIAGFPDLNADAEAWLAEIKRTMPRGEFTTEMRHVEAAIRKRRQENRI